MFYTVIITGAARSGKDLFIEKCKQKLRPGKVNNVSIIDPVKEIAKYCGWDGGKTDKDRAFLCELKDLLTKYNNGPMQFLESRLKTFQYLYMIGLSKYEPNNSVAFFILREAEDINRFKEAHKDTIVIRMTRAEAEQNLPHNHADEGALSGDYEINLIIDNNGSVEDLDAAAEKFLADLFNGVYTIEK